MTRTPDWHCLVPTVLFVSPESTEGKLLTRVRQAGPVRQRIDPPYSSGRPPTHGSCPAHGDKMARRHENVYDAMLAGFMKLVLVICIGALTLSKFAGFEWCDAGALLGKTATV